MNIPYLSIKRPTFVISIVTLLLVIGVLCYSRLGVDQFPDVTFPVISVVTPYRGAGPQEIETLVSKPLEEELSSISGIKHVSSTNQDGLSFIIVEFSLGTDLKYAEQQIRDKVALVKAKLPKDIDEPLIRQFDPSDQPIVQVALFGSLKASELYDLADLEIKPRLEQVPDVSVVNLIGGSKRQILVSLDRHLMKQHEISLSSVSNNIGANSQNIPVGEISRGDKQTLFRTIGEYRSLDQIKKVPVSFFGSDVPITVADLGTVSDTTEDVKSYGFYNGQPALLLDIYRRSGSNTVAVADGISKKVEQLNNAFKSKPGAPVLTVVRDNAKYIRLNVDDVKITIGLGILLTILVVYLFLGNVRSTFITGMALPNSIIGTFILMYVMGFTINIITLLALSLAVGLLIDDAIVVRENIWRHLEQGYAPKEAAIKGTNEVMLAVVATTLTVISVFLPVGFLQGTVGQFFKQLGLTVVFAMVISLFDALTMAPLMSAYLAKNTTNKKEEAQSGAKWKTTISFNPFQLVTRSFDKLQDWLTDKYEQTIRLCLRWRWLVLLGALMIFFGSLFLILPHVKKTFLPASDVGFYQITLEAAPGTSLEAMLRGAKAVEGVIRSHKENLKVATLVGNAQGEPNVTSIYVEMIPYKQRPKLDTSTMKELLRKELLQYSTLTPLVGDVGAVGNQRPFTMNLIGEDLDTLAPLAQKVMEEFKKIKGLTDLDLNYRTGQPEFRIIMEPKRLEALGVSSVTAGIELRSMVDGVVPAKYRENGNEYDIRLRLQENQRDLQKDFGSAYVPNINYNLVRLADVAKPEITTGPSKINRRDRARFIQVSGELAPGGALGNIQDEAKDLMTKIQLPKGVSYEFVGQAEDFKELITNMIIAMVLGVTFMYLILASLYESLLIPLLIMSALPFGIVGVFLALLITGESLNIFSMIAVVMLLGLVAKNSILLIDYTIHQMRQGKSRDEALILAGKTRLRPILMTTVALIAGMLPLAFGLSEVGRFRRSMGISVIGGLISSTVLTLIVIPAAFEWVDRFRLWSRKLLGRPEQREIDLSEEEETKPGKHYN